MSEPTVAVLFARADSIYKTMPGCDVYDAERDALTFPGGLPVVAHPPCRLWGRLRHMSTAPESERELALWAVDQVRQWGGVLEHPSSSTLWPAKGMPRPGAGRDEWGGFTLDVDQHWWGHRARKRTWLYVVGVRPSEAPRMPMALDAVTACITRSTVRSLPHTTMRERDATPPALAVWLCDLARLCVPAEVVA